MIESRPVSGGAAGAVGRDAVSKSKPTFDVEGFEGFRERATDSSLSPYEKVGFPDEYRAGKAGMILDDIASKLTNLSNPGARVLDIGPGCSDLPVALMERCAARSQSLILVDSAEMLDQLPSAPPATKLRGSFPDCLDRIQDVQRHFDAILVYSVAQYVFAEGNLWRFVDGAAALLADGGQLLLGDIPNASRRKRFLSSEAGRAYHRRHFGDRPFPRIDYNQLEPGQIDDAVALGVLARMRAAGFDAFVLPQGAALPMANRREDILICKP